MSPSSKIETALVKLAAGEMAASTPSLSDWFINGINPQVRDSLIGAGVGGVLGGISGLGEGRSFLGSALGGALLGGAGGYFRKPLWEAASPIVGDLRKKWESLKSKPSEQPTAPTQPPAKEQPEKQIV